MNFKELSSYIARTKLILQNIWVKIRSVIAQSSLVIRGFVLRGFANSRGLPKNKNISLGPSNGQNDQNCSTNQTGLRTTLHDVQGVDGKKKSGSPAQCFCKENTNAKNIITLLFGWGCQLFADFRFSLGSWTNLQEKQKTTVLVRLTASAIQGKVKCF